MAFLRGSQMCSIKLARSPADRASASSSPESSVTYACTVQLFEIQVVRSIQKLPGPDQTRGCEQWAETAVQVFVR